MATKRSLHPKLVFLSALPRHSAMYYGFRHLNVTFAHLTGLKSALTYGLEKERLV